MPEFTKRTDVIVRKQVEILDGLKEVFEPKLANVYYGQQELMPEFPCIAIEGSTKLRSLPTGATHFWRVDIGTTLYVYHEKVQSSTVTREETDALVEQIEDMLHGNLTMDGLVIFGYVTRSDPGTAVRRDTMLRTTRMSWEGRSKERF